MHRLLLVSLLMLAGCAGTTGPRMRDANPQKVDPRGTPIYLQEERAKASLAYPNIQYGVAPRTWAEIPEEQYGQRSH
ncbi:MAG TPA: hypothetical protein VMG10_19475 [Gemmataceae bacterium]|nr:hypothetical protein [Gemmataceae bacterium]